MLIILIGLSIISIANASKPGAYAGLRLGLSQSGFSKKSFAVGDASVTAVSIDNDGLAGCGFIGYQFDPNFGVELSYEKYANTTAKNLTYSNAETNSKAKLKQQAITLMLKASVPIKDNFGAYAKAGYARTSVKQSDNTISGGKLKSDGKATRPSFGLGLTYNITPSAVADIGYSRIVEGSGIDAMALWSLGLSYFF